MTNAHAPKGDASADGIQTTAERFSSTVRDSAAAAAFGSPPPCDAGGALFAARGHVSASTQNQAFNALLFLYQQVLGIELPRLDAVRAKRPKRLPTVLCPEEVGQVLSAVEGGDGVFRLMAGLCYGAGVRREECCRLRVHDLDLHRDQIMVRHGKGGKDRVVMLPKSLRTELERQLAWRRQVHERDLAAGLARVALPDALARKYPRAAAEFGWQFLFASRQRSRDPKTGDIGRHHVDPGSLARAVVLTRRRAKLNHRVGCHTLRHASRRISSSAASICGRFKFCLDTRAWRRR